MNAQLIEIVLDELRAAWRFRWVALAVAWGVCLVAWVIVFLIPDSYQASARVFVDTRTMLRTVTQGITIDADVNTQINRVRQAMLGGPQLEKVAQDTDLLVGIASPRERQEVIEALRGQIEITGGASRESPSAGVYVISYRHHDRDTSLRVVDRMLNTFVEDTLGGKRSGSEQAQQFLEDQIADYERRLASAEQRLADFKKRNVGLMPGAQGDYFSRLQGELAGLNQAQTELGVATRRRDELRRQLRGEEPMLPTAAGATAPPALAGAGASNTATRLREAQARLDDLLLRFTEKHPDVIALKDTIEELQQRQREEIEAARRGDPGAAARTGLSANPVYQSIQLQLNQAEVEIAAIEAQIADRRRKIAALQALVNTAPEVEAEFARLNRDYDVTRAQYHALVERLERTRLGEEAEATGTVTFEIIDPPTASFRPVDPNRPVLLVLSFVAALGAGAAAAYLLSQISPVFSSVRQIAQITGLPVAGVVSMTWLDRYRSQKRHSTLLFAGAAASLVVATLVLLVVQDSILQIVRRLAA